MRVEPLLTLQGEKIPGPLLLKPNLFGDERGFFYESWNSNVWKRLLKENSQSTKEFVQDNHSRSEYGVLRGLHYQLSPYPQAKLVRCILGEIFDVAVDIRRNSPTFGKWVGVFLNTNNKNYLWIPEGFAHGFLTLTDYAEVLYKTTDYWNRDCERAIRWDDDDIQIDWPKIKVNPKLSEKDAQAPKLFDREKGDFFV